MNHIICQLIQLEYFNLKTLNNIKQGFNYYEVENMSSVKRTFLHYNPLLIGDLFPKNNTIWLVFISFIEIIDILLLSKLNNQN